MNRPHRSLACLAAFVLPALLAVPAKAEDRPAGSASVTVYVGTYTGPKSKGIYMMKMDPATGALGTPEVAGEVANPSFVAIHPTRKYLYAIGELPDFKGKKGGAISAFSIDPATGKLTLINQQSAGGSGPCYVAVDATGKVAMLANYGAGSVESLPINADGSLGEPATYVQHVAPPAAEGTKPLKPRGHSINPTPDNKYAVAADLGLDQLLVYKIDTATAKLTPHDPPFTALPAGSGPRHFAFHPSGKFAYNCNEMGMTATAYTYDGDKGTLTAIQTINTLPDGAERKGTSTAEVQVHPSGKFVYVSNRGHGSIAIFAVDEATGKLTAAGHQPCGGKTPRNFGIDPTGTFLLAANQDAGNIVVFKIDPKTGGLTATGATAEVANPVCVKFLTTGK
jgi:6-phosphogluconolactonase